MNRYRGWVLRRYRTAQCNPVLAILGLIVVIAAVTYIYRQVIIDTVITVLIAAGCIAGVTALGALTLNTIRWHRAHGRAVPEDIPAVESTDTAEESISREAEWLASGIELAFGPDGSLKAKDPS